MAGGMHDRGHAWLERQPLQRVVRILLECTFVCKIKNPAWIEHLKNSCNLAVQQIFGIIEY